MNTLLTKKNILLGFGVTFLYTTLSLYLINYRIIFSTISGDYPVTYKIALLNSLMTGTLQILPLYEIVLIVITAMLVGINALCLMALLKKIKDQGKLKITTGGTSLLAIAGAGCPSCGISVLSVLGISSSAFPLQGIVLQAITLTLLGASLFYNIKKLREPVVCKINK